jgi:hypothetical protein
MKIRELITEMPYLHREELPYKALSAISVKRLHHSYQKIGEIGEGIDVYQHSNGGVIAGQVLQGDLYLLVAISVRKRVYPVEPTGLDDTLQVSMVHVAKGEEEQGLTKKVYAVLASLFDLVSDHEQYLGAQGLWKSLARSSGVNVYVFDGNQKDYVRDASGKALKYNGANIPDDKIWGSKVTQKLILLVGTTKELA